MKARYQAFAATAALLLAQAVFAEGHTTDDCAAFTWDVERELAVMRKAAHSVDAAVGEAVRLQLDQHYSVRLAPQAEVRFVVPAERAARSEAPRGGVVRFSIAKPGRYRVAITTRHWIDVVAGAAAVPSADHEGRAGCALMHKVVAFDLPAAGEFVLQLSGQDDAVVDLAITGPIGSGLQ